MKLIPIITLLLVLPATVFAQSDAKNPLERLTTVGTDLEITGGNSEPSFAATIGSIIQVFISFAGAIMMIYLVYAGYLWLTAAGEEEKITKAKAIIRGSIIGIIIIFSAYIITAAVIDNLTTQTSVAAPAATETGAPIREGTTDEMPVH